jgi:hypothetical protein
MCTLIQYPTPCSGVREDHEPDQENPAGKVQPSRPGGWNGWKFLSYRHHQGRPVRSSEETGAESHCVSLNRHLRHLLASRSTPGLADEVIALPF